MISLAICVCPTLTNMHTEPRCWPTSESVPRSHIRRRFIFSCSSFWRRQSGTNVWVILEETGRFCVETEGEEEYQWRMCPAAGTGEVPVKAKQNRSSSFPHREREGERDLEGTVSAATSSLDFLQNIRRMN